MLWKLILGALGLGKKVKEGSTKEMETEPKSEAKPFPWKGSHTLSACSADLVELISKLRFPTLFMNLLKMKADPQIHICWSQWT